jgi:hypothetical protein
MEIQGRTEPTRLLFPELGFEKTVNVPSVPRFHQVPDPTGCRSVLYNRAKCNCHSIGGAKLGKYLFGILMQLFTPWCDRVSQQ